MKTPMPLEDIRQVGLEFVPRGSFLITGRPRIRSAWLAAVLSGEDMNLYHEAPLPKHPIIEKEAFGLVDPSAATLWPRKALKLFEGKQIIVIDRPEADSRASLEKLAGQKAAHWQDLEDRYQMFLREADVTLVPYASIADYEVVSNLVSMCTGAFLTRERFDLFDGLHIEQDFIKAQRREAA